MFDFDDDALEALEAEEPTPAPEEELEPVLCCFYSGGFTHDEGIKLLMPMLKAAAKLGLGDSKVLGHPDYYNIESEGYDGYPDYVDALVEDIDSEECNQGRPLLIFGHSRGGCGAMALATRLGSRVKKIYICGNPPILPETPTAWELMSKQFKANICPTLPQLGDLGGDGSRALLTWFASLDPANLMLKNLVEIKKDDEFMSVLAQSKMFSAKVALMKVQYKDAVYPLMTGDDPLIKVVSVPMMVGVTKGEGMTLKVSKGWEICTTGPVEHIQVPTGHMDSLDGEGPLMQAFVKDMAKFIPMVAS